MQEILTRLYYYKKKNTSPKNGLQKKNEKIWVRRKSMGQTEKLVQEWQWAHLILWMNSSTVWTFQRQLMELLLLYLIHEPSKGPTGARQMTGSGHRESRGLWQMGQNRLHPRRQMPLSSNQFLAGSVAPPSDQQRANCKTRQAKRDLSRLERTALQVLLLKNAGSWERWPP